MAHGVVTPLQSILHYITLRTHTTVLCILSGTTRVSRYQKKHSPTHTVTPIMVINHPLSASSIYYDPRHPPCSMEYEVEGARPRGRPK